MLRSTFSIEVETTVRSSSSSPPSLSPGEDPDSGHEQPRPPPAALADLRAATAPRPVRHAGSAERPGRSVLAIERRAVAGHDEARPVIRVRPLRVRQHREPDLAHRLAPAAALL